MSEHRKQSSGGPKRRPGTAGSHGKKRSTDSSKHASGDRRKYRGGPEQSGRKGKAAHGDETFRRDSHGGGAGRGDHYGRASAERVHGRYGPTPSRHSREDRHPGDAGRSDETHARRGHSDGHFRYEHDHGIPANRKRYAGTGKRYNATAQAGGSPRKTTGRSDDTQQKSKHSGGGRGYGRKEEESPRKQGGYGEHGAAEHGGERRPYRDDARPRGERSGSGRSFARKDEERPRKQGGYGEHGAAERGGERRPYRDDARPRGERSGGGRGYGRKDEERPRKQGGYGEHGAAERGGERRPYRDDTRPRGERSGGGRSFARKDEERPRKQGGYGERGASDHGGERRPYRDDARPRGERSGGGRGYGRKDEERPRKQGGYGERGASERGGERRPYRDDARQSGERSGGGRGYARKEEERPRKQGGYGERGASERGGERRPYRDDVRQSGERSGGGRAHSPTKQQTPRGTAPKRSAHSRISGSKTGGLRRRSGEVRTEEGEIRLNKFLAEAGVMSRRKADELIRSGVVRVNGTVVTELGVKVDASKDNVSVRGTPVYIQTQLVYILLNKPKDCITTTDDEKGRRTVMELVPPEPRVFPVGRLDRNTTGAILLTNDGELANQLTHPSFHAPKTYLAEVEQKMQPGDVDRLRRGVRLDDGMTAPCEVELLDPPANNHLGIVLHEGRNRQVRRMLETLGYTVKKLDRIAFGNLTLEGLRRGAWRYLETDEVRALKKLVR
ncbi:MAG: pseudouridine synthase [Bacteroidia bacterium]|nr:pseudouridine synthase [Bacteroidia bacterium]